EGVPAARTGGLQLDWTNSSVTSAAIRAAGELLLQPSEGHRFLVPVRDNGRGRVGAVELAHEGRSALSPVGALGGTGVLLVKHDGFAPTAARSLGGLGYDAEKKHVYLAGDTTRAGGATREVARGHAAGWAPGGRLLVCQRAHGAAPRRRALARRARGPLVAPAPPTLAGGAVIRRGERRPTDRRGGRQFGTKGARRRPRLAASAPTTPGVFVCAI
ncbi:MAG TPA: hypothetical protein VFS00_03365, partial [Polyangiaceae bacterium]|nr:hypothetical protein [Polyangiaceae bacterium]